MEIESQIQELLRKESPRQSVGKDRADNDREVFVDSVRDSIQRVANKSVAEIDELIAELTQFRDHLQDDSKRMQSEIARVQSEIDGYTRTNEAAWESMNAINQSLGQFKRAVGPSQSH